MSSVASSLARIHAVASSHWSWEEVEVLEGLFEVASSEARILVDDARFVGGKVADDLFLEDIGHDANDCKKLYIEKAISIRTGFLPSF